MKGFGSEKLPLVTLKCAVYQYTLNDTLLFKHIVNKGSEECCKGINPAIFFSNIPKPISKNRQRIEPFSKGL